MSKGDNYRPVDKEKYDKNYLRIYGSKCNKCDGTGMDIYDIDGQRECEYCGGVGYIEKRIKNENL